MNHAFSGYFLHFFWMWVGNPAADWALKFCLVNPEVQNHTYCILIKYFIYPEQRCCVFCCFFFTTIHEYHEIMPIIKKRNEDCSLSPNPGCTENVVKTITESPDGSILVTSCTSSCVWLHLIVWDLVWAVSAQIMGCKGFSATNKPNLTSVSPQNDFITIDVFVNVMLIAVAAIFNQVNVSS